MLACVSNTNNTIIIILIIIMIIIITMVAMWRAGQYQGKWRPLLWKSTTGWFVVELGGKTRPRGGDALCGQRLTSDAALWIQITLLHTHHTYPLSQFSTLLSTLERHLHYKTLCLCSFPQQWHPPKNIINIFWTYNPTSNSQYSYMKISNSSLQWLQNILRLLAQYSIRPALILSATLLLKSRHSSEIQPWKWKPSKIWQFIIHLLLIVRLTKYCWFKGISVLRLIVVNWYIVNF